MNQFKEDKKKEVLESTFRSISVRFKHLEKFSNLKNNPYLSNINHDFARKFELYLIDLELNRNTIRRIISTLKGLTNYFYMNEFLTSDPLINYKKPKGELIDFVYLNENELHKIES
ncbi:phage integrase SAM-like domain-containing protein, partial [Flammeovirga pacifica]|uniref:phage integrase SAM-like domain-containing protein n=1 Tax=Flammeovirga pacifica TaxID=915059 RepID=UPI00373FD616